MHISKPLWYCARTKAKHEHIAAANVTKGWVWKVSSAIGLEAATRRGMMRVVEPLFPCYIFIRCVSKFAWMRLACDGISSLVHFGQKIPAVPDAAIDELKQCFDSEAPMNVEDRVVPGVEVTIVEGSFMGFSGMVVRALSAGQR